MNLTFDQAVEEHRKMWRAIAEMEFVPRKRIWEYKAEYFKHYLNSRIPKNGCFCCEYAKNILLEKLNPRSYVEIRTCIFCPLKWVGTSIPGVIYYPICTNNPSSPYSKLVQSLRYHHYGADEFKRLCLEIAELPVNEEEPENILMEV